MYSYRVKGYNQIQQSQQLFQPHRAVRPYTQTQLQTQTQHSQTLQHESQPNMYDRTQNRTQDRTQDRTQNRLKNDDKYMEDIYNAMYEDNNTDTMDASTAPVYSKLMKRQDIYSLLGIPKHAFKVREGFNLILFGTFAVLGIIALDVLLKANATSTKNKLLASYVKSLNKNAYVIPRTQLVQPELVQQQLMQQQPTQVPPIQQTPVQIQTPQATAPVVFSSPSSPAASSPAASSLAASSPVALSPVAIGSFPI